VRCSAEEYEQERLGSAGIETTMKYRGNDTQHEGEGQGVAEASMPEDVPVRNAEAKPYGVKVGKDGAGDPNDRKLPRHCGRP
jgi:hypothetical protein